MTPKEIQQFEQDEMNRRSEYRQRLNEVILALPFKVYTHDGEISDGEKIPEGVYQLNYRYYEYSDCQFVIAADSKEKLIKHLKKAFCSIDISWKDFLARHELS